MDVPWQELFRAAERARARAYAPYSKFKVGAAALFEDGSIYPGCNVENASYGLALCAERNAIGSAVIAGKKRLLAMAILADAPRPCPPCGMCRQVMAEFAEREAEVHCRNLAGAEARYTVGQLLPDAFGKEFL